MNVKQLQLLMRFLVNKIYHISVVSLQRNLDTLI